MEGRSVDPPLLAPLFCAILQIAAGPLTREQHDDKPDDTVDIHQNPGQLRHERCQVVNQQDADVCQYTLKHGQQK